MTKEFRHKNFLIKLGAEMPSNDQAAKVHNPKLPDKSEIGIARRGKTPDNPNMTDFAFTSAHKAF